MKCEECGGTGKVQKWFYERTGFGKCEKVCGDVKCEWCNGTGEVEQTNEEWFCQLSTVKKAKIIKMVINVCISCKEHGTVRTRGCLLRQNMAKGLVFLPCMDEDGIVEWLKQPHEE